MSGYFAGLKDFRATQKNVHIGTFPPTRSKTRGWCYFALFVLLVLPCAGQQTNREYLVYAGTYTRTASKGIYAWRFQPSTGKLTTLRAHGRNGPSVLPSRYIQTIVSCTPQMSTRMRLSREIPSRLMPWML